MAVKYTEEQQKVISLRDCNILVAAAAGSGKTAVLVERIISRITRDTPPLDVDRLLIVTYTEAAASEMKERILRAIGLALENDPDNPHLQKQATLIHQAQITTIHSFCLSVIREYFYTIDLDPMFRVGEEGEIGLLKRDVAEAVLEEAFQEKNEDFADFVESFASGKDDSGIDQMLIELYDLSRNYPNPDKWLDMCAARYRAKSPMELKETDYMREIMEEIRTLLSDMRGLLGYAVLLCAEDDGPAAYGDALTSDLSQVQNMLRAESYDELAKALKEMTFEQLGRNKKGQVSIEKAEQVKSIRDKLKRMVKSVNEQYFFDDLTGMHEGMMTAARHMETLTGLVKRFADAFSREKKARNLIDFDDMLLYALQILTHEENGRLIPSRAAREYAQRFTEVMIDEYQDSNLVQEAILTGVSGMPDGRYNMFMVGDVKQSIYRFRLSRPDLFMDKYRRYKTEDRAKEQRIDLHKNFRSRKEVLDSANFIFGQVMTSRLGGITYDEKAALYYGAEYAEADSGAPNGLQADYRTELMILEAKDKNAGERLRLEAGMIAGRIRGLMEHMQIIDKESGEYRKLNYGDIVILLRSLKGTQEILQEELTNAGIPVYAKEREGYFETQEVQLALNYLKILDNPRQDIPFTAVITSMFAHVTSEELAVIRSGAKGHNMYERTCSYAKAHRGEELGDRLLSFLSVLESYRNKVPYTAIHTLIWQIFKETGYGSYVKALPGGKQRDANLQMLIEKAASFEKTSYKGLFHFVRYIEQLRKYNIDYGNAGIRDGMDGLVTIMSIHKSKGLEFPVVIVAGMGRQFNRQEIRSSIMAHPDLGIGIDAVDPVLRTKEPTILKKAIRRRNIREASAEELRILYVAMTRAKEKTILTGSVTDIAKELTPIAYLGGYEERELSYSQLAGAESYLDWILPALLRNKCFAGLLKEHKQNVPYKNPMFSEDVPISVRLVTEDMLEEAAAGEAFVSGITREILENWDAGRIYDSGIRKQLEEQFSFRYPYEAGENVKQKLTVSEVKRMLHGDEEEEEGEEVYPEEKIIPLLPGFLRGKDKITGALTGTAYHKCLEILDFTKDYDEEGIAFEIKKGLNNGILTEEMASCINTRGILRFLRSKIAGRMKIAALDGKLTREQPFVIGIPAEEFYREMPPGETILIQGIIDAYFEEDGKIVLLDYKTDRIRSPEELKERYHIQLEYYAAALNRLTGKQVKEQIFYSFALGKEIRVK